MSEQDIKRRKPEERRKTVYLHVRVAANHKELMQQAADRAGISLSAWAIERLLRVARDEVES